MKWFILGGLIHCATWPLFTGQAPVGGLIMSALCIVFYLGRLTALRDHPMKGPEDE